MIEVGINVFNVYINKARGVGMAWGVLLLCHVTKSNGINTDE